MDDNFNKDINVNNDVDTNQSETVESADSMPDVADNQADSSNAVEADSAEMPAQPEQPSQPEQSSAPEQPTAEQPQQSESIEEIVRRKVEDALNKEKSERKYTAEEAELSKEFDEFRTKKILSCIGIMSVGYGNAQYCSELCADAKNAGFKGVLLGNFALANCRRKLRGEGVGVCALVDYGNADSLFKIKAFALKAVKAYKPDGICVAYSIPELIAKQPKKAAAELIKLKKACGKISFALAGDLTALSGTDIARLGQLLTDNAIGGFIASVDGGVSKSLENIKLLSKILLDKCKLDCFGDISDVEDAKNLMFAGVKNIYSTHVF